MPHIGRKGPRPEVWKVKGEIPHKQWKTYMVAKAQASFRNEPFELTFEQYQNLWKGKWQDRGRDNHKLTLTRQDYTKPWCVDNCVIMTRLEHLRRQRYFRQCNGTLGKPYKQRGTL